MKHFCRRVWLTVLLAAVLTVLYSVPAAADAADYDVRDYKGEKFTVIVDAQDGTDFLYLRYGPSMEYEILETIYDGTVLEISGTSLDPGGAFRWGNTKYNGRWGWVSLKQTSVYTAPASDSGTDNAGTAADRDVEVKDKDGDGYLYLRSGPGLDYEIYCNIYDGEILHITREASDGERTWGKTVYNGQTGWVSLKYTIPYKKVTPTPAAVKEKKVDREVVVQALDESGSCYLRSGPGKEYGVICNLYDDDILHITREATDAAGELVWGKTEYDGQTGWVSLRQTITMEAWEKKHATPTPTAEPTESAAPTPTPAAAPTETVTPTPEVKTEETVTPAAVSKSGETRSSGTFRISFQMIVTLVLALLALIACIAILFRTTQDKRHDGDPD